MRQTLEAGTNRTFSRESLWPLAMQSSTVPVPTAYMYDPPIPEIGYGAIGWSDLKSERSGVMWVVALVSRKKGHHQEKPTLVIQVI